MLRDIFGPTKPKPAEASQAKPAAPAPRTDSWLGAGTHFEGTLKSEGGVRVDGAFIGDINTQGRILIGEHARLEGNLIGESVDVAGVVRGDIVARRVSVLRTGRVWGDLRLEKLMTEEGGFIQGLVTMEEKVKLEDHLPARPQQEEASAEETPVVKVEPEPEKVKVSAKASK